MKYIYTKRYLHTIFICTAGSDHCSYFDKIKLEGHFILWSYSTQLPQELKSMFLEFIFSSTPAILFWISDHCCRANLFLPHFGWLCTLQKFEVWDQKSVQICDIAQLIPIFYVDYGIMINFAVTAAASGDQLNIGRMGCLCQVTSLRPI